MVKEDLYADLIDPRRPISHIRLSPITPNRRGIGSMKKYYQVALIAVALLSLVSLLIYRHEYNKLRYVLGVLNFYGKPGVKETDLRCFGDNLGQNHRLNSPLPLWHRLNDELFVYSAHRVKKNEIRAIAFGKVYDNLNMKCNVYFEGKLPALGTFKHSKINENSGYTGYQLICQYEGIAIPEGVAFSSKETGSENEAQILNVRNSPDNLMTTEMALCVAPPTNKSILRTDMISFLNYHQVVGVRDFVVYDYGIPTRFIDTLKEIIVTQSLNMSLSIIPWNFPFSEISSDIVEGIIEADCLYRLYNEVDYSATLNWEEYLVLKYHNNLLDALKEFEKTIMTSERYFVDTLVFCSEKLDNKFNSDVTPVVFRKSSRLSSGSMKTRNVYISKPHESLDLEYEDVNPVKADTDLISVNHYRYCSDPGNKFSYTKDKSILRFVDDMFKAPIYKEYITKQALLS